MSRATRHSLTVVFGLCLAAASAWAADEPAKAGTAEAPARPKPVVKKNMKMREPMAGEMKKDGMMKGDVKKDADKKEKEMKGEMEQEEKSMKK